MANKDQMMQRVGEVSTDSRRRLSLGKFGLKNHHRYEVYEDSDGILMLVPLVAIPLKDVTSQEVVKMVEQALAQPRETYTKFRKEDYK